MGSFTVDPSGHRETTTEITWFNSSPETANARTVEFAEQRIEKLVWTYVPPVIVTVGTIGNVLSLAVLLRSRMRSTSVYFYLTMLSCADTMVLYVSAFKTWIRVMTEFELLAASNFCCKSIFFLTLVSFHLSAWLVVLVTLDRFIVVWFPLKATTMCALSRARLGAGVLIAVTAVCNLHVFWTFALRRTRDGVSRCLPVKEHAAFVGLPFHVLKLVTYSALPFLTILVLNVAIIVRIRRSPLDLQGHETQRQHLVQGQDDDRSRTAGAGTRCSYSSSSASHVDCLTKGRNSAAMKIHIRLTYMLLSVSISWLLLTAPWTIETLVNQKHSEDRRTKAREILAKTVCFMLYYVNHSINFFLYCVTGNRFRRELGDLFAQVVARVRRRPPPGSSPSSARRTGRSNCVEMDAGAGPGPVVATAGSHSRTPKTSRSDSRL